MVITFGHEENDEKKTHKKYGQGERKKEYKRGQ